MQGRIDEASAMGSGGAPASAALAEWDAAQAGRRRLVLVGRVLVGVALLGFWHYASGRLIDPLFVSSPSAVAVRLWRWTVTGSLWTNLSVTMYATLLGFLIGAGVGFALGLLFGRNQTVADIFDPYITALYSLPKIALAPLFIIWFGIGELSKILLIYLAIFAPTVINTVAGVDGVPRSLIRMGQSFGLSWPAIVAKVVLPGALPAILSGFRITTSTAVILLVAIVAAITLTMRKRAGQKVQDVAAQVAVRAQDRLRVVKMEAEGKQ